MEGRALLREPRRSLLTGAKRPFARPEGLAESLSASTRSARGSKDLRSFVITKEPVALSVDSEPRDRNDARAFGGLTSGESVTSKVERSESFGVCKSETEVAYLNTAS